MNQIIQIDRTNQNKKGEAINDFKNYFNILLKRTSYIKASEISRINFSYEDDA